MSYSYILKKTIAFAVAFLFILHAVVAQTNSNKIKGTILDDYGHAIKNAQIQVKGTAITSNTNDDGKFEIAAPEKSILVVSSTGFDVYEYTIIGKEDVVIRMDENYLIKRSKIDMLYETKDKDLLVGAVSTIYTPQISTTPAPLYAYALTGRLPGLYTEQLQGFRSFSGKGDANYSADLIGSIARTGLAPFSDNNEISIKLRGQNPVVVVDGIQRDMYSIDPESIESISVMKDALSAISLGQRSSRGILMVTSKKPEAGPARLSFTAELGVQQPLKQPKPLDAFRYGYLINEALQNDGKKLMYSSADLEGFKNNTDPYKYPNVNWYDEVMKSSALLNQYNLNVTGGGKVARYAVSLSYMNQDGLLNVKNNDDAKLKLQRYIINSNIDIDVTKDFNVGLQMMGRIQDANQPGASVSTVLDNLLRTPNNAYPIFNKDGSFGGNNSFTTNLYASLNNSGYIINNDRDIMANLTMKYKFDRWVPGLWAKVNGNISVQSATATDRSMQMPVFQMQKSDVGDIYYNRYGSSNAQVNNFYDISDSRYWYAQAQVGYDKTIGKDHNIQGLLMADLRRTTLNFDLPGTATNYVAKANYNYKRKYMAEAAINYSGYDRYKPGDQYGLFYAFGLGWDMAQEDWFKNSVSWVDILKLRATYGRTGNGVDNSGYFIWRQVYSQDYFQTAVMGVGHGVGSTAYLEGPLANTNITWEKGNKFDVGMDVSLFKNHLQITADYYRDMYSDLLQIRGKSIAIIGTTYPVENIGKNLYTGGELSVTYQNNVGAFNYFVTANGSVEKTKVVFMDEQARQYEWNKQTGQPVGQRFGYIADGFFKTEKEVADGPAMLGYTIKPGDIKYRDLNGDGVVDQFDMTPIGKTSPLMYYGLTAGFNYKGFGFSILFQGVGNRNLYIDNWNVVGIRGYGQLYGQMYEEQLARWTPETANTAAYPKLKANDGSGDAYTLSSNSLWMHNGNYWRIKNVNLQYNLPYKWTNVLKLAGVTVFVNAQNLYTWSAYDRVDPEVGYGAYPNQRVINTGINVKF